MRKCVKSTFRVYFGSRRKHLFRVYLRNPWSRLLTTLYLSGPPGWQRCSMFYTVVNLLVWNKGEVCWLKKKVSCCTLESFIEILQVVNEVPLFPVWCQEYKILSENEHFRPIGKLFSYDTLLYPGAAPRVYRGARLFEPMLYQSLPSKCHLQMALLIKTYFMI